MLVRRTLLGAALAAPMAPLIAGCTTPVSTGGGAMPELPHDPDSYARPNEARVTHVSIDLTADFSRKVLSGTATLDIVAKPDAREIVLDVMGPVIHSVKTSSGAALDFHIGETQPDHGAPLTIALRPGLRRIVIEYETAPDAAALLWLEPAQTSSGKQFVFSQGESILTRSWLPTQDSPGVRQTHDTRLVVPDGLKAVMSAEMLTPNGVPASGGRAYRFRMTHPIPCYLISFAIGDIAFRSTGPRTGVYAEPQVVEHAAWEFADMERMLERTEALYGPYRWGRYDVLVLPPSFPYGGMENPRLTFATPTIIAGDRSLVNVITHEMAHSWSGNLVTNARWDDSWLNEGFTTYIEGRITEALYGSDQYAMSNALAWAQIQTALRTLPPDGTLLHQIAGVGPDQSSSAINYSKGALFLRTIEGIVGREAFDAYLRSYFDRHAFQAMTTEWFLADFREHVVKGDGALEQRLMLDQWAYQPGLPSNAIEPHAEAFDRVAQAVTAFNASGRPDAALWEHWGTAERQRFLQTIPRTLPPSQLDALEHTLHLNETGNSEVLFDWLILAVRNGYTPAQASIEGFLKRQGRRKYVQPIYGALMRQGPWGQEIARRVYAEARASYHPVTAQSLDRVVTPAH